MSDRIRLMGPMAWVVLAMASVAPANWAAYEQKPDEWYASAAGRQVAGNILSWQDPYGAWPKNQDTTLKPYDGDRTKLQGTFDNGATCGEMRFLARAYRATKEEKYQQAFMRGLEVIFKAQYPNGGWPQYYPLSKQYHRHITFNDGSMIRVMQLLQEVAAGSGYEFVPDEKKQAAAQAVVRGIDCIIRCQIVVNGKKTAWCAQHDEVTLAPALGRSYELPSISGGESAGILRFLMNLPEPNQAIAQAIEAGVDWYHSAQITGLGVKEINGVETAIPDPQAKPVWARFYDIETNQPIFSSRDGIKQYDYNLITAERRNGYAWYGNWGNSVFKDYDKWKKKQAETP